MNGPPLTDRTGPEQRTRSPNSRRGMENGWAARVGGPVGRARDGPQVPVERAGPGGAAKVGASRCDTLGNIDPGRWLPSRRSRGQDGCMIEAVVFDLDGVIVDSEPVWEDVRRQVVAEYGGRWAADTQRRLMGMSTAEWAGYLSTDLGVGLPPETIAALVIERMVAR